MNDLEWLAALKAGDEVLIDNRWNPRIEKVERVTPTLIVVGGYRFRKNGGRSLGGNSWDSVRIRQATQQDRERYEEVRLRTEITNHLEKGKPSLSVLRAMHACIKAESSHD